jgi:ubiquinone/menaquinone biosynthesis C-methylase UbiE
MSDIENALYNDSRLVDLYDLLNSGDWDYAFYAEQIGKQRRRVLDLGCGTGTFAFRLAAAGHEVVAVDPSPVMINNARRRSGSCAVEWIVGDVTSVQNRAPFDVVTMTGHAFQCLLTDYDVQSTLRTARAVLRPGGRFMFETRNPVPRPWTGWTPALSTRSIHSEEHGPVDVFHECIAVAEPVVEFQTHYVFGRNNTQRVSKSRLRFMSSEELASSIDTAGFREIEWFGDWSGGSFQEASSAEIIAICHA